MNELTEEEIAALILFGREGITRYTLPGYAMYVDQVEAARTAIEKLLAQQKEYVH